MMKKIFLLGLSILFYIASGQNDFIRFEHLSAKNGLSQGHILCMLQDSEGYIWVGTYHGLNRYNGYNFDVYYADPNANSIFINVVFSLFEDREGKIWCGTWGVDVFDKKTETFKHIPAYEGDNSLSAGEVSAIKQDKNGNMWFATQGGGLNKYNPVSETISYFKEDKNPYNGLKSNYINDILADKNNRLWIATENGGLSRMNLEDETIITYRYFYGNPLSVPSDKISCLFEDKSGNIWIGDANGNIALYNEKNDNFQTFNVVSNEYNLRKSRVKQIEQDYNGNLIIATNGAGYVVFNKDMKFTTYLHNDNIPESIISNETYSLLVDKTNTVFIGSFGRGISKYSPYNHKFDVYFVNESNEYEGDINAFTDCVEDNFGHIITGTYYGFLVYDKNTWSYKHYLPGKTYEENKILTLKCAPDNTIWISSVKYLYRYDKDFNKINSYSFDENLKDPSIYTIEFDYLNNLWIGLFTKGLIKIPENEWRNTNKKKFNYKLYLRDLTDATSISGNQPWVVFFNKIDSTLWIGNEGGLSQYIYKNDNFKRYNIHSSNVTVKMIGVDSKNNLWLGTIGEGLFSYNLNNNTAKRYTVADGLCHSFIYGLLIDKNDNIWITSEAGMSRFNIETEKFRNYDEGDGLPDDHFDDKSETALSDGRIYMGTNKGFIIFNPEKIIDDTSNTNIVLTSLKINNKPISFYNKQLKDTVERIPLNQLSDFKLNSDERDIIFEFAALNFASPQKVQYKYKLEGYDKEWIDANAYNRSAKYTNLDGGKYNFQIRSTNGDGIWTDKPFSISFTVKPLFYKTIWFRFVILVLILGLSYLYILWRISREIKQKNILANLVDQRTLEISNKNGQLEQTATDLKELNTLLEERQQHIEEQSEELEAQRDELALSNKTKDKLLSILAHDLKNPFNIIIGYCDLLITKFKVWDENKILSFLYILKDTADNTFNLLENLLQWSRSQSGALSYEPSYLNINDLVQLIIKEVYNIAIKKNITIKYEPDEFKHLIFADKDMLGVVFRNLLINAIKFSQKDQTVSIIIEKQEKGALFKVIDTGVGMKKTELDNLFILDKTKSKTGTEGEKGTGLGLVLCKDFIGYHNGEIWAESKPGKGTTFCFTIPIV